MYRELAELNRDAYLPNLAMSVNNHAIRLAEAGRADAVQTIWQDASEGLDAAGTAAMRTLRAGYEWTATPDYATEHAYLQAHQDELLVPNTEALLVVNVLRRHPSQEAERYLRILALARADGVDAAYKQFAWPRQRRRWMTHLFRLHPQRQRGGRSGRSDHD